jgi:hypothetical protein
VEGQSTVTPVTPVQLTLGSRGFKVIEVLKDVIWWYLFGPLVILGYLLLLLLGGTLLCAIWFGLVAVHRLCEELFPPKSELRPTLRGLDSAREREALSHRLRARREAEKRRRAAVQPRILAPRREGRLGGGYSFGDPESWRDLGQ